MHLQSAIKDMAAWFTSLGSMGGYNVEARSSDKGDNLAHASHKLSKLLFISDCILLSILLAPISFEVCPIFLTRFLTVFNKPVAGPNSFMSSSDQSNSNSSISKSSISSFMSSEEIIVLASSNSVIASDIKRSWDRMNLEHAM